MTFKSVDFIIFDANIMKQRPPGSFGGPESLTGEQQETLLEELSFSAPEQKERNVAIDGLKHLAPQRFQDV